MRQTRIAQISDLHISADRQPYGCDSAATLARTLAAIAPLEVDAIIATGDLVNDGEAGEYAALRAILQKAPAPVYLLPGNHDDPNALRTAFPDHTYLPREGDLSYAVVVRDVRIVMLDAMVLGQSGGRMTPARAEWLDETLHAAPGAPTLVALHHPPIPTGDPDFDAMGLAHANLLADVIVRHRQVRRVVCGHFHRVCVGDIGGAPCLVAPSTAWHFQVALSQGAPHTPPTAEPVGFALHILADAAMSSVVVWT